jgi:hypothetical protein
MIARLGSFLAKDQMSTGVGGGGNQYVEEVMFLDVVRTCAGYEVSSGAEEL